MKEEIKEELNIKKDKKKIIFKIIKIVLILVLYIIAVLLCCKSCKNVRAEGYAGHNNALYITNSEDNYNENYNIILSNYENVYFDLQAGSTQVNLFNYASENNISNKSLEYADGSLIDNAGWSVSPFISVNPYELYTLCFFDDLSNGVEIDVNICVYNNNLQFIDYDVFTFTHGNNSYDIIFNNLNDYENIKYLRFDYITNYHFITLYQSGLFGDINRYIPYGFIDSEYQYNYKQYDSQRWNYEKYNTISVYSQVLDGELYLMFNEYYNIYDFDNGRYICKSTINFFTLTLSNQTMLKYDYYIVYFFNGSYLVPYFVYNNGYHNNNYTDFNYTPINRENIILNYSQDNTISIYSYPYLNGSDEYDWKLFGEGYTPYSTIRGAYLSTGSVQEHIYYLMGTTGTYDFEDIDYHNEYLFGDLISSFLNIKLGTFVVGPTTVNLTFGVLVLFVIGLGALFIVIKVMLGG